MRNTEIAVFSPFLAISGELLHISICDIVASKADLQVTPFETTQVDISHGDRYAAEKAEK